MIEIVAAAAAAVVYKTQWMHCYGRAIIISKENKEYPHCVIKEIKMVIQEKKEPNNTENSNHNNEKMSIESNLSNQYKGDSSHLLCSFVWWTATSLIASILIATGFWLPYWIQGFYENIVVSFSPFRRCNFPVLNEFGKAQIVFKCVRYDSFDEIPTLSWKLTTLFVGFGVLFSVLVALILLFSCCMPYALTTSNTFYLVLFQVLIILVIASGCLLYPLGWDHYEILNVCGGHHLFQFEKCHLSISVYLLGTGLLLLFLCLIFGMITSKKLKR